MISIATTRDASAISVLVNSAYRGDSSRKGWTTEADLLDGIRIDAHGVEELIRRPGTVVLKLEENETIIGCVELARKEDSIYLGMLSVNPELQAKGAGRSLLKAAETEAVRQGCFRIFMTVISLRKELIAWYVRNGYQDSGKRQPFLTPDIRLEKKELEFIILEKKLAK